MVARLGESLVGFPFSGFSRSSRDERPDGSGHRFPCRACSIPVSTPLQRDIRFFRLPLPATATDRLAAFLPRMGHSDGLTEFRICNTTGLGAVCSPGVLVAASTHSGRMEPTPYRFGSSVVATSACSILRRLSTRSLTFTLPVSLAPHPPCSWQNSPVALRSPGLLSRGYIVRALRTFPLPEMHCP